MKIHHSYEYLLAKIGVDAAKNEPLKVWEVIQLMCSFASSRTIDRCDCNCGEMDPDCLTGTGELFHCSERDGEYSERNL